MNISIYNQEFNIELAHASAEPAGHGHKKITIELKLNGETNSFSATTDNMSSYDDAMDIEDYEEKQQALFDLIYYKIEELIYEWAA